MNTAQKVQEIRQRWAKWKKIKTDCNLSLKAVKDVNLIIR